MLVVVAGLQIAFAWGLANLAAGRAVYAIGSSPGAARLAGLHVERVTVGVFAVAGALVGIAAVLNSVRFNQIPSNTGLGLELKVIAAVVVGGTAISGGRAPLGTLLGVILLSAIGPALTFLGVSVLERAIHGVIILAAVAIDAVRPVAVTAPGVGDDEHACLSEQGFWASRRDAGFRNGEWILLMALAAEIALFAVIAPNFASVANFFEISRLGVELGPRHRPDAGHHRRDRSGWRDDGAGGHPVRGRVARLGLPLPAAAMVSVLVGLAGGGLNAILVARFGIPPLIVTLGTLSLFRGIAEGITQGPSTTRASQPDSWRLARDTWAASFRTTPDLPGGAVGYILLLHRSVIGRALYAIGFGPDGARTRHPGQSAHRARLRAVGGRSAGAGIIYVAHLGQARADAGTGYELDAITAVVLGGTSVFGGRGTLGGTVLGLVALAVLRNGLRLAALPSELAGVLTGALLIATIAIDRIRSLEHAKTVAHLPEDADVKNSQVAVLCAAVITGSLIVASTNVWLVRSIAGVPASAPASARGTAGAERPAAGDRDDAEGEGRSLLRELPRRRRRGRWELGVELIWDGPDGLDAARQNEVIENWITAGRCDRGRGREPWPSRPCCARRGSAGSRC